MHLPQSSCNSIFGFESERPGVCSSETSIEMAKKCESNSHNAWDHVQVAGKYDFKIWDPCLKN